MVQSCQQLQGNTIDHLLDLKFESDQHEITAIDELEECIQDIEDHFDHRQSEARDIDIGNTGTEWVGQAQNRTGTNEEGKDVKHIDTAGAGLEGDATNKEQGS